MTKKYAIRRKLIADWRATKEEIKEPGRTAFREGNQGKQIQKKYFKKKRRYFRALLEDVEVKWFWSEDELSRFKKMWDAGYPVEDICKLLPAKPHEVALLIIDGEMTGTLKARPGGMLGAAHPAQQTKPIEEGRLLTEKMKREGFVWAKH